MRCQCSEKVWDMPARIRADEATESLLRRKGFVLAGDTLHYHNNSVRLTIFEDGVWFLENAEPTATDLHELLFSLPDKPNAGER